MPEDNTLESELREIAKTEADKNRVVSVDNFPEVQLVEVTNPTEAPEVSVDLGSVEEVLKSILSILKVEGKEIDLSNIESRLQSILQAVSKEVEDKEDVDYTDVLESIKSAIPESLDLDDFFERLEKVLEDKLDITAGFKDAMKGFQSSGWLPVVEAINARQQVSTANSSTTALDNAGVFTGEWEDVTQFPSVVVAVKTDQNGTFSVQFSPDGVNQDSTLTRHYRTSQIEAPHRFTVTRRYCRVVFTNDSGSDQTYFRLQTLLCAQTELNAPMDSSLAQDFDATVVRPTDYNTEVALGRRQGATLWNKFGYNNDVDVGTEVIASWGGTFTPLTTATTLTIVSTSTDDDGDPAGTGCNSIVVYGVDSNRGEVIEVVTLNGTTNVVTTSTWLGINRVAMFLCGSGQINAGDINITATTGGSQMAQMVAGQGVTQQCIFHVPQKHQFIMEWLRINSLKQAAQDPKITVKFWVYSPVSNGKQEVYKVDIDTSISNDVSENPQLPFPVTEKSVVWLEATTDKADTIVNARFSGILVRDVDA